MSYKSCAHPSSSPSDFTCDSNKKHDLSHLSKEIPLKQLASGSPHLLDRSLSDVKETEKDYSSQNTFITVYAVFIAFAIGVTISLVLHIYLWESLVFVKGMLVSDDDHCTALGQRVLHDGGSSVDAAIVAALCLGVVHPHASGVGGGGVMMVHNIHKNETRVINFQGTAPKNLKEEMLQNVSELKAGLYVGVPGMLRGLHHAHSLYGSLSWEDLVSHAAAVAKEGFNVSFSLAEAVSKVKDEHLSQRFRDTFFPDGQALRPGSFLRMPSLAGVLEAGLSNFYDGIFTQEMVDELRVNGGVLTRGDISNYSVQVEQPVEGLYNGKALKPALVLASGLGDPKYNSSVMELLSDMLSKSKAEVLRQRINSSTVHALQTEVTAGQVVVMGPDNLIVSIASSLNRPFGSRIITQSGVILNSLILDFSWPNKTRGQLLTNQNNRVQPGKRPLSSLVPTIVLPVWHKCGTHVALSSPGGEQSLNVITQVISALSFHKEKNNSFFLRRLHPQLQPHRLIVDWLSMEPRPVVKEKFFIVIRGKSRKGFCRGCIGRVEAETQRGELMGLLYCGGSNAGSPKSGGIVKREDTYPLTRHQAQLLLFVSAASKRLELLCNPQLFSAICELTQDDLVVVKHKKGHMPAVVKNLMQIGKKENKDDLLMLGFEVEFVDNENKTSSRKPAPLPMFSAADIIQVVPSYSTPLGLHWKDGQYGNLNRKGVTCINSMPNMGISPARQVREKRMAQSVVQSQSSSTSCAPLEVGSMVEVMSNTGVTVYGVVRWLGVLGGKTDEWAGIELDYDVNGCSDGKYGSQRYFTCKGNRALFVPITKCSPDGRFSSSPGWETPKPTEIPPVPLFEDSAEDAPPILESEALSLLVGRMKGIQGHINSCYLDATLFSLFSSAVTLDNICQKPADTEQPVTCTLRKIVNRLRRQGFVPAESVMNFRKQLGCDTFRTEEKDPEEFIIVLFQKVLCMEPLLKLRSRGETSQGAYTFQIFLEKEQMGQMPTVQQLLDTSCLSGDLKFEEMPSCLMIHMPRFGNKYKMFSHIIPSTELDITDLLYNCEEQT
ncbi:Glutathione hydrolase 7 [Nibea albiflora]|uniref:Glutathione hydrolase 7 n=1 Tax=Nibea albiflora TaxID=240163 RepID=A0ACB7EYX8_NIBAL|nr:Glutathione hydrolase 7 [Nibea albiflora]